MYTLACHHHAVRLRALLLHAMCYNERRGRSRAPDLVYPGLQCYSCGVCARKRWLNRARVSPKVLAMGSCKCNVSPCARPCQATGWAQMYSQGILPTFLAGRRQLGSCMPSPYMTAVATPHSRPNRATCKQHRHHNPACAQVSHLWHAECFCFIFVFFLVGFSAAVVAMCGDVRTGLVCWVRDFSSAPNIFPRQISPLNCHPKLAQPKLTGYPPVHTSTWRVPSERWTGSPSFLRLEWATSTMADWAAQCCAASVSFLGKFPHCRVALLSKLPLCRVSFLRMLPFCRCSSL